MAGESAAERFERAIMVHGQAMLRRVPDLAVISAAVRAVDKHPDRARDEANRRTSAILARLREQGVPEADVQAASLRMQPLFDHARGKGKLTGFEATRPLTIRVREVDLLGPILDGLVDDGATQVHGTSMQLAEPEAAGREALASAFAVARDRAEALAAAAGVALGAPLRIEEYVGESFVPMFAAASMARDGSVESAGTEVALGELEVYGRVRAWFALG
ncbi:MAG TPA: SIMPL domain-containing protein [candidate division Zixibacteria bacterium]|nr:SIMPL domain-containing protein [candidate division Zixibacteria bacterium]